jgi:hypothetical protein
MMRLLNWCAGVIASLILVSCGANFDQLLAEGKYKEAEKCIKKMKGMERYNCAEALINEYIELEEYDRAIYVYEKCTPEHCDNDCMRFPSLYCHGANYELTVTALFVRSLWRSETMTKYGSTQCGTLMGIRDMTQRLIISL